METFSRGPCYVYPPQGMLHYMRLDELPIYAHLPAIGAALARGHLVLSAETGAGKTTAIPAYLASSGSVPGKMIVLEPRRLAAVAAAARVNELLGDGPGGEGDRGGAAPGIAGYRVKGETRVGPRTRVEFVTEAVFARMAQEDPLLDGVSIVALDEFHERSAWADLGLALAAEAAEARGDLSVLVMSATLEAGPVAAYLGCPTMAVPGRLYPVETRYRPPRAGERLADVVARAASEALEASSGDILVFLPGLREIGEAEATLSSLGGVDARRLHGSMGLAEQRSLLSPRPGDRRRVILATSIAETSLTVPRVTAVVDSGLSRLSRLHAPSGLNRLVTERVSLAEADQRRGRAGRLGPGLCLRCWDESDLLRPSRGPELARIELSGMALEAALRGSSAPDSIRWLEPPPRYAWDAAAALIVDLGLAEARSEAGPSVRASDASRAALASPYGPATAAGRRAAGLGADPRAAAAVIAAADSGESGAPEAAALATALLAEPYGDTSSGDLREGLEALLSGRTEGTARRRILDEAERILARAGAVSRRGKAGADTAVAFEAARSAIDQLGDILAPGYPDRLARRAEDGTWEFASGRRASSVLSPPRAEWLLAADVDAGDPLGRIRLATPVSDKAARAALERGARSAVELRWRGLAASAWEIKRYGVISLSERRLASAPREALEAAFAERLGREGLEWLPWDADSRSLVERARFASARTEPGLGDWSDEALAERLGREAPAWLSVDGPVLDARGFLGILEASLGRAGLERLEAAAPAFVVTPGGRRLRPSYPAAGPARLAVRIQELFGLELGPAACGEPMALELLSPADRPLQVTSDLAGFWKGAYPSIRAEMARRYPRHRWPEDPLSAEPGVRTGRR